MNLIHTHHKHLLRKHEVLLLQGKPNLSSFYCRMCKPLSFVYIIHNTHKYSCLTFGYNWTGPCSFASAFAACHWGKLPRRINFSQCLLVHLPPLTCSQGSWMPNNRLKEETLGASKKCSCAATPGHPATVRMRRAQDRTHLNSNQMTSGSLKGGAVENMAQNIYHKKQWGTFMRYSVSQGCCTEEFYNMEWLVWDG